MLMGNANRCPAEVRSAYNNIIDDRFVSVTAQCNETMSPRETAIELNAAVEQLISLQAI